MQKLNVNFYFSLKIYFTNKIVYAKIKEKGGARGGKANICAQKKKKARL